MIKMLTIIGARPQIIKAAAISRAIENEFSSSISEIIVHSGQHYDSNMSSVFFEEMGIPKEKYNLNAGGGSHAIQTARMMVGIEEIIIKERPNLILLYGDTNSTLAGALVGAKLKIPIVHVEGGVRINTKDYPEEVNRILTDNLSSMIFVPSEDGMKCLAKEGFNLNNIEEATLDNPKVIQCGDIMYDNSIYFSSRIKDSILERVKLKTKTFALLTMHRHNLSEENDFISQVFDGLDTIISEHNTSVIFPIHPRIRHHVDQMDLSENCKKNIHFIDPVSYLEMIELEMNCNMVITDSGGVQKEAYFFKKPCLILLENTPWIELIENGTALLCGYDKDRIIKNYRTLIEKSGQLHYPDLYGDGRAAELICSEIVLHFTK